MSDQEPFGTIKIVLYENPGKQLAGPVSMTVYVSNHRQFNRTFSWQGPVKSFNLAFRDGPGDDYTVVVSVDGYKTIGNFVHLDPAVPQVVNLILIPSKPQILFPSWKDLQGRFPHVANLFVAGVTPETAEQRYDAIKTEKPLSLVCFMNLCAAMHRLGIGDQKTPLEFFKEIVWDDTFAQDRFFGYVDSAIVPLIQAATDEGQFAEEEHAAHFHPGATSSYKQIEYDYSNLQLTFHAGDRKTIDRVGCIKIEADMDLYKELVAHGLGEVFPNLSTRGTTNPLDVFALRWIDVVQGKEPLFDPGYSFSM